VDNGVYWNPDDIDRMIPPLDNGRGARRGRPKSEAPSGPLATAGEPPVLLARGDRRAWDGEEYPPRRDGGVDRSAALYRIACGVARGLTRTNVIDGVKVSIIADAIEDRDQALGFDKYADRPEMYAETAERAFAEVSADSATRSATRTSAHVAADAPPPEPVEGPGPEQGNRNGGKRKKRDDDPGLVKRLSDAILDEDRFAVDAGGRLYHYAQGTYKRYGDRYVKRLVQSLLEEWSETSDWSKHLSAEVVEYIVIKSPELWGRPPVDEINCENGILNLLTHKLRDHSPEFLTPVRIPVRYDPAATCEAWNKYVVPAFPEDAPELVFEIAADLIAPARSEQKAILAVGEGQNGKSTALTALVNFVGKPNTTAMSLQKIEGNRFSVARLYGKLANICPDLPSARLSETSMFKSITGGDAIEGEYKYKDGFEFEPFCRLVFSANQVPRSEDATFAFFRRWLVVPFERTFEGEEEIPRETLDVMLADSAELSGVLNRALGVIGRVRRSGFTESETMQEAWAEFRELTDPVSVWLDRNTVEIPNAYVSKAALHEAYKRERHDQGQDGMTPKMFGQAVKRLRPHLDEKQRTYNGQPKQKCWIGLGFASDDSDGPGHGPGVKFGNSGYNESRSTSTDSPDSPDSPDPSNCFVFENEGVTEGENSEKPKINNKGNRVNRVNGVNLDLDALTEHERMFVRNLEADGMSTRAAIREVVSCREETTHDISSNTDLGGGGDA
jgi:P4 family phage/plasmid primase-like protien